MTETTHELSTVDRTLGTRTLPAGEARVLTISRVYDTDAADLWQACTDAQRIRRWFLPVSGELRVGGHYQLEGNAGGVVERCEPPHAFAATWEFGGEVSWIEVRISGEGARARLTLEHVAHVQDEWWAEYGPGATGVGWDLALHGLGRHVASGGAALDPAAVEAWSTSPEGVAFIGGSSAAWCAASIAAGTPAEQARAAAGRTTAFYTGSQPGA